MAGTTQSAHTSEVETTRAPLYKRPEERAIALPESTWQRITAKAHALYEERGREGCALQDWLDAEYIVNEEIYETH